MEVKYDRTLGIDASLGLSVNVTGGAPLLKVETEVGVTVTHSLTKDTGVNFRKQVPFCKFRKVALFQKVKHCRRYGSGYGSVRGHVWGYRNITFTYNEPYIEYLNEYSTPEVCGGSCDCCK
jgi:hypothetical protein